MCIRDRVSTQSTWGFIASLRKLAYMRTFVLIFLGLIALGSCRRDSKDYSLLQFLTGLTFALAKDGGSSSYSTIAALPNENLDIKQIVTGLCKFASSDRTEKIAGMNLLFSAFSSLKSKAADKISNTPLEAVINQVLSIVASPENYLEKTQKYDINFDGLLQKIAQSARWGLFFSAGAQFGSLIHKATMVINSAATQISSKK
eukprot:TRINITY_DN15402_c0_g1_i1.p1 TRINITY_DN15402_c0_g1~~TRINITY_DN15402_c0_g1_i1.p1  ORF type:complete len:222 (+),score=34.63 TRINITY_DN15402_c0_g1_i1:61-666(+)